MDKKQLSDEELAKISGGVTHTDAFMNEERCPYCAMVLRPVFDYEHIDKCFANPKNR